MVNQNIYDDVPYKIPSRDPREINAVERLKKLQQNQERTFINDDEVQYGDMEKEFIIAQDVLERSAGNPGGIVTLNAEGKIDSKFLPSSIPAAAVIVTAPTKEEFPEVGTTEALYLASSENEGNGYLYRWCNIDNCYKRPDDSLDEILEVCGGSADSF